MKKTVRSSYHLSANEISGKHVSLKDYIHYKYKPLHCQVLFADRVVEEFNAVELHHRLQIEKQKNSPLLMAHFLQTV